MILGSPTPPRLGVPASTDASFPDSQGTYTSPDGAIVVPGGALDRWFAWRATRGAVRGDVVAIGDSTTFGAGGNYSWLQRLRDRAVAFGLPDGGKGMFGGGEGLGITYDAPEINGFVSGTFGGAFTDAYDNLDGAYYYDPGTTPEHTLVLQFRQSGARLWFSDRAAAGDFTYSIDGGAPVTVHGFQTGEGNRYVSIAGLTPDTTHTITITNLGLSTTGGGTGCWIAFAPVNATGLAVQNYATSGDTIYGRFYRGTGAPAYTVPTASNRYQSPLGLVPGDRSSPLYTGATRDTTWTDINPVLAVWDLGFNDLSNTVDASDLPMWTEYVKIAAGASRDAGVDCIILSGQLPYNANWPTYGAARFNAVKAQALASGVVFVDFLQPVSGPSLSYVGGTTNPHLTKVEYQAQADYLWDNLLGLTS